MHASTPHLYRSRALPGPRVILALLMTLLAWLAPPSHAQQAQRAEQAMVVVPNIVGMTRDQALAAIWAAKLAASRGVMSSTDRVTSQSPAAGAQVPAGSTVYLNPTSPQPPPPAATVTVPNVINTTMEQARAALFGVGLALQDTGRWVHTTNPALDRKVAVQSPAAGTKVPARSAVSLQFYMFVGAVTVPNVVGMDKNAAGDAIRKAGLSALGTLEPVGDPARVGKVLRQTPAAGTSVAKASAVTLVIGAPGANIRVPNVVGMTFSNATGALSRSGLRWNQMTPGVGTADAAKVGTVARQVPGAGVEAASGSQVQIWLYVRGNVRVPNLMGMLHTSVGPALSQLGLRGQAMPQNAPTTDRTKHGTVMRQSPAPNQEVATGSIVQVWFYVYVAAPAPAATTRVPNLVNMMQGDAQRALIAVGLKSVVQTRKAPFASNVGKVMSQSPAGGATVATGSNVTIVIGVK